MGLINVGNVCRLCLAEHNGFSEPLSDWVDDVLLIFGMEVFLDDDLPQQICRGCHHTLLITSKLKDMVYETDMLLKHGNRPDLENDKFRNFAINNTINNLNITENINSDINNAKHSEKLPNVIDKPSDVKYNLIDTSSNQFLEMWVILEKLPDYISNTSLIYCSVCLLAFTDNEQFNIHINMNTHKTNKCSTCSMKYENRTQLWKHFNSVHADDILMQAQINSQNDEDELANVPDERGEESPQSIPKQRSKRMTKKQRKKKAESDRRWYTNLTAEKRKKLADYRRNRRANRTEEQRRKDAEYNRRYYISMNGERRKKNAENMHNVTEEWRKKYAECYRNYTSYMADKKRKKDEERQIRLAENRRKRQAYMTEELQKKDAEYKEKCFAILIDEHRKKLAENKLRREAYIIQEQRKKEAECTGISWLTTIRTYNRTKN